MNKLFLSVLATCLCLGLTMSKLHAQNEPSGAVDTLSNEFIKLIVNKGPLDLGRFSVETTLGDPSTPADDKQPLVFGRPIPWTSYTTLLIDGKTYVFGGLNKKIQKRSGKEVNFGQVLHQSITEEGIVTECDFGSVKVIQKINFFRNPSTKVKDSALISYDVINNDSKPHEVGVRIMLDTKLGTNDGAPFRIGSKAIDSETVFSGNDLQDFWQTFDSLTTPNVVAQGTLRIPQEGISAPNKMALVNWGTLADNPWEVAFEPGRGFEREGEIEKDTALALYWDPISLQPNQSRRVQTVYGLGGLSLSKGTIQLGLTSPAEMYASSPYPFLVMGYVSNTTGFDAYNVKVAFQVPKGFDAVEGSLYQHFDVLKAGSTIQIPVKLKLNKPVVGKQTLRLQVSSTTFESNSIARDITLLQPPTLTSSLSVPVAKEVTFNYYLEAKAIIKNETALSIPDVEVQLSTDRALSIPAFDVASKKIGRILPGQSVPISWKLRLSDQKAPLSLVKLTVSSPLTAVSVLQKTIQLIEPKLNWNLLPSQPTFKLNEFGYVLVEASYFPGIDVLNMDVLFDPTQIAVLRVSPEEWMIKSNQLDTLSVQDGLVRIKGLVAPQPAIKKRFFKIQFKALQPGVSELSLVVNKEVQKIKLIVEDGGNKNDKK